MLKLNELLISYPDVRNENYVDHFIRYSQYIRNESLYGEGISKLGELLDLGVNANIVEKAGSWFSYKEERIGQGRENAKKFLRENHAVAVAIESAVRENAGLVAEAMLVGSEVSDDVEGAIE